MAERAGLLAFRFEVEGVAPVSRVLGAMASAVKDMRPVWNDITDDFVRREQQVFDRQGAVAGWARWQPLNENYADWKKANGFSPKIMVRGGRLMFSLTTRSAADFIMNSRPKSLELGTKVPYAVYHQSSKPRRQKAGGGDRLPKREPLRITEAQRRMWVHLMQKFLIDSGQYARASLTEAGGMGSGKWMVANGG